MLCTTPSFHKDLRALINKILRCALIVILLAVFILLVGRVVAEPCVSTELFGLGLDSPMALYTSEPGYFIIEYPESWIAHSTPGGYRGDDEVVATFRKLPHTWPRLYIIVSDFPDGTLDQVIFWRSGRQSKDLVSQGYHRSVISSYDPFQTSHVNGTVHLYSYKIRSMLCGSPTIRCLDYYIYENGRGFELSFCAELLEQWPEVEETFQRMLESFTIVK